MNDDDDDVVEVLQLVMDKQKKAKSESMSIKTMRFL